MSSGFGRPDFHNPQLNRMGPPPPHHRMNPLPSPSFHRPRAPLDDTVRDDFSSPGFRLLISSHGLFHHFIVLHPFFSRSLEWARQSQAYFLTLKPSVRI